MARYDYNVIVIEGGSGGLVASLVASALKEKVLLIEKHKMGGDCLRPFGKNSAPLKKS